MLNCHDQSGEQNTEMEHHCTAAWNSLLSTSYFTHLGCILIPSIEICTRGSIWVFESGVLLEQSPYNSFVKTNVKYFAAINVLTSNRRFVQRTSLVVCQVPFHHSSHHKISQYTDP